MHQFGQNFATDKGKEENERLTVVSYILATGVAHDISRNKRENLTEPLDKEAIRLGRLAWAALRNARLFHFHPFTWLEIYHHMDRFTTETVTGLNYQPPEFDEQGFQIQPDMGILDETEQYAMALMSASTDAPYPEKFPFDSIFIGLGQGIALSESQAITKFLPAKVPEDTTLVLLLGAIMTSSGYVWEVYRVHIDDGRSGVVLKCWRRPDVGWDSTLDLVPWYLPVVVDTINDHKTFVLEGYPGDLRKMVRHKRKQMGFQPGKGRGLWTPPDFYRIELQDKIIKQRLQEAEGPIARHLRFRHDVRGHERCYIKRGVLPMDIEVKNDLLQREYKIFEHTKPDDDAALRIFKRGQGAKHPDEWIAIKTVWVDDFVRGDEHLPYVPALRVAKGSE